MRTARDLGTTTRAVARRYGELDGSALAAHVTLASFLALFPLLVLAVAVVGFVAEVRGDLDASIVDALGLEGPLAALVTDAVGNAQDTRRTATVVGLATLLPAAVGLAGAMNGLHEAVWQTRRRSGLRTRGASVLWLGLAGTAVAGSVALTARTARADLDARTVGLTQVGSLALGVTLFSVMVVLVPNPQVRWRDLLPGALLGAVGFEALKVVGTVYVPRLIASTSALYGTIGTVLALLVWLGLVGRLIAVVSVVHVVRWEARHGTEALAIAVPAGSRHPGTSSLAATRAGRAPARPAVSLMGRIRFRRSRIRRRR